jgi:hypothetical protein
MAVAGLRQGKSGSRRHLEWYFTDKKYHNNDQIMNLSGNSGFLMRSVASDNGEHENAPPQARQRTQPAAAAPLGV